MLGPKVMHISVVHCTTDSSFIINHHQLLHQKWRPFCDSFKHVEDFSFATLLRLDSTGDYSEANSIIVTKIQFYAIEVARNREGCNDGVRLNFKPTPRKHRAPKETATMAPPGMEEVEYELKQILTGHHQLLQ